MIAFEDLTKLKTKLKKLEDEQQQSLGILKQLMKDMKKKFNVKNLKEAKLLLAKLQKQENEIEIQYMKEKKAFETKWNKLLEEN